MTPAERRALLATDPNPDARLDYVVTLNGRVRTADESCEVELRYVPDRLVLDSEGLQQYLQAVSNLAWDNLEHTAVTLLDDFNDQLVARWIHVSVTGGSGHSIVLEDRQPSWRNDQLLQRLRRV